MSSTLVNLSSPVSPHEVLGEWIGYEYQTRPEIREGIDRYLTEVDLSASIISSPDYDDQLENSARINATLHTWRGVIVDWILSQNWNKAKLNQNEINRMVTLYGEMWNKLTQGSFKLAVFVSLLTTNEGHSYLRQVGESKWIQEISTTKGLLLKDGPRGPIVAVKSAEGFQLVEGYHRVSALIILRAEGRDIEFPHFYVGEREVTSGRVANTQGSPTESSSILNSKP